MTARCGGGGDDGDEAAVPLARPPARAAAWRGVRPAAHSAAGSAPAASSEATAPSHPAPAAACRGVRPSSATGEGDAPAARRAATVAVWPPVSVRGCACVSVVRASERSRTAQRESRSRNPMHLYACASLPTLRRMGRTCRRVVQSGRPHCIPSVQGRAQAATPVAAAAAASRVRSERESIQDGLHPVRVARRRGRVQGPRPHIGLAGLGVGVTDQDGNASASHLATGERGRKEREEYSRSPSPALTPTKVASVLPGVARAHSRNQGVRRWAVKGRPARGPALLPPFVAALASDDGHVRRPHRCAPRDKGRTGAIGGGTVRRCRPSFSPARVQVALSGELAHGPSLPFHHRHSPQAQPSTRATPWSLGGRPPTPRATSRGR